MRILILAFVFLITINPCFADTRVRGYMRRNGTYVQPYEKTSPNNNRYDNYSTKGNNNPYTGKKGYESPYRSYERRREN